MLIFLYFTLFLLIKESLKLCMQECVCCVALARSLNECTVPVINAKWVSVVMSVEKQILKKQKPESLSPYAKWLSELSNT